MEINEVVEVITLSDSDEERELPEYIEYGYLEIQRITNVPTFPIDGSVVNAVCNVRRLFHRFKVIMRQFERFGSLPVSQRAAAAYYVFYPYNNCNSALEELVELRRRISFETARLTSFLDTIVTQ